MLRAVEFTAIAVGRRSRRCSVRRCSSRRAWVRRRRARRSSTSRSRKARTRLCRSPSCRSAGRARAPAAFDLAGVVSSDLGSSGRFAPHGDARHGVAADAGVAGRFPAVAHARRRLPRHRHADGGRDARQLHGDVSALRRAARRVADGLQAASRPRGSAQSGASHLRHDLPGAHGHPGRLQHADRVHQRGTAARQHASCSA